MIEFLSEASIASAFWSDAEALASPDASASCYDVIDDARVLPVVYADRKTRSG
jgi:hypothetical protein